MFNWMNGAGSSVGNLFSMDDGFKPDTPMSSPDAIKTGSALSELGFFGKDGGSEFSLPNSVKAFQNAVGETPDGVINPGGPTENAISNALQQKTLNTTGLLESTDTNLPSNISVNKTGDTSYQASASFGTKPKRMPKVKLDPITGLADPIAMAPKLPQKSKAQMDKLWEQVAENKKAKTTQEALQGLLENPLYRKKDQAYVKHVQDEFKRAYPGNVQYDETGQMTELQPAIAPHEVRAFSQPQQENAEQWDNENPERTWNPKAEQKLREEYARNNPEPKAKSLSYQEMLKLLERDKEAFDRLPQADRSDYHAYMRNKHSEFIPNQNKYEREQQERNAKIAGREAGAGSYVGEAVTQPFLEANAQIELGWDLLRGKEPDYKAFDEKMKAIRDRIPVGYQSARGVGQAQGIGKGVIKAGSILPPFAPVVAFQTGGEMANQLAKAGVPLNGQRVGAALMGVSSMFGKGLTKGALRKVNDMLVKGFGKDLRQMTPQQLKMLGDTVLGEAWSVGPKGLVEKHFGEEKKR